MNSERTYPLADALKAQKAMRDAAGLEQETFPVQAFVGMISDEIEALRDKGMSDQQIVDLIREHSSIDLTAAELAENYASPEERQQHSEHG